MIPKDSVLSNTFLNKSDLIIYDENEINNNYDNDKNNIENFDKNISIVRLDNDTTLAYSYKLKNFST